MITIVNNKEKVQGYTIKEIFGYPGRVFRSKGFPKWIGFIAQRDDEEPLLISHNNEYGINHIRARTQSEAISDFTNDHFIMTDEKIILG